MPTTKTVFISGNFIVLHPGHLRLFQFAKDIGHKLIVGVIADKYQAIDSLVPEQMRLEGVINNVLVDEALIIDEPIPETLRRLKPDIVLKGKEHEGRENKELEALDEYGGQLVFSSGETEFSTLNLLASKFMTDHAWTREVPEEYQLNHQIELGNIRAIIEKFRTLNVAVIGDLIIDEYIDCQPLGMSQEDPCIAVTPIQSHRYIGGAGIVALHAAGLGAKTHFLTTTGDDELHDYAHEQLCAELDVNLIKDVSRPTTLKQRYRAKNSSLLRVSHLHQNNISLADQKRIKDGFLAMAGELDLLVFSDFNYGCLPDELVTELIQIAKQNNIFMAADSQSSSQVGNIRRFEGVDLITPTEREVRVSLHDNQSGLVVLADKLSNIVRAENVFLKMGEDGVLVYNNRGLLGEEVKDSWTTDILPAFNIAPKDVAGAGDSMLISGSMALSVGASIWEAALIASHVAALQVSRVGNLPVSTSELLELIDR
jgi:rfaE bifunctional protein kinase chain/domain